MVKKLTIGMIILCTALPGIVEGKILKIPVNGMVCAFCGQSVKNKFQAEEAVKTVSVEFGDKDKTSGEKKKNIVTLELKDGKDLPPDRIKEILESAGYSVGNTEPK